MRVGLINVTGAKGLRSGLTPILLNEVGGVNAAISALNERES